MLSSYMIRYQLWQTEDIHPDTFREILKELKEKFKVTELPNGYIIVGKYLVCVLQGGIIKQEYHEVIDLLYEYDRFLDQPRLVYQPGPSTKILNIRGEMKKDNLFTIIFEREWCTVRGRVSITIDPAEDTNGVEELKEFLEIWYKHNIAWRFDLLRPM